MDTLKNLNKFWRSSALLPSTVTHSDAAERVLENETPGGNEEADVELEDDDEEEESFFELELVMRNCSATSRDKENESLRLSSKVVPIEPEPYLKPHSPISILKSAPKFKVSLFRKPKADLADDIRPDSDLKTKVEEEKPATISTLIRENSSSGLKLNQPEDSSVPVDSSKRFSKDVMQKYLKLKLIRPFHINVAKKSKTRLFDLRNSTSLPAPASEKLKQSYSSNGFREVCKQLGKSRSASSMGSSSSCSVAVSVSGSRRDESLLEHDDGIQSAILHCKRSFNSSRESSMHSRSSSDSTQKSTEQEPTPGISSSDSYL